MSTQIFYGGIFFMSYIVTPCILIGATIDYGILMSSSYVTNRSTYKKKESLRLALESAVMTIFTSGLILTICIFVISFISIVGLLVGIKTICSVLMIMVILPSVLYLFDTFVLKLSYRKKKTQTKE